MPSPMPSPNDIVIELHLNDPGALSPKTLVQAFDTLEESLYSSDRRDVERIGIELALPSVIRDASLERLRNYRHRRLLIIDAQGGSLTLIGLVAGVSYWVLEKTIGEAATDGFKDTQVYRRLRETVRRFVDDKALFVSEGLRRAFRAKDREVTVRLLPPGPSEPTRIVVSLSPPKDRAPEILPSLGQTIDRTE